MTLLTLIVFIVIFSILVLVHEWGHFYMARKSGIKVEEFGIGLPPKMKSIAKDKQGTLYTLNWIPFGGFVRLYGEDSSDPKVLKDKHSFASKGIVPRAATIIAGVFMNFILAWVIITIGFTFGMQPFLVTKDDIAAARDQGLVEVTPVIYIHEIAEGSPLLEKGLKAGDSIAKWNGGALPETQNLPSIIKPMMPITLTRLMDGKEEDITVIATQEGKLGFTVSNEDLVSKVYPVKMPFYQAPIAAFRETVRLSGLTVKLLGNVVISLVGHFTIPEGVAGPVGIYQMTGKYMTQGIMALLQFVALLSISLAVLNVMPFPALDGGRLLFILFELFLGRKPNAKMESIIHATGFALLMILIVAITWNDIVNLVK